MRRPSVLLTDAAGRQRAAWRRGAGQSSQRSRGRGRGRARTARRAHDSRGTALRTGADARGSAAAAPQAVRAAGEENFEEAPYTTCSFNFDISFNAWTITETHGARLMLTKHSIPQACTRLSTWKQAKTKNPGKGHFTLLSRHSVLLMQQAPNMHTCCQHKVREAMHQ